METYGGVEVTCNFMYLIGVLHVSLFTPQKVNFFFYFELRSKFGVVKWLGEGSGVWVFFTSKFRTALRVTQALPTARARSWPMTASWSGCGFLFLHSTGQLVFTLLYHSRSTFTQFLIWYLQYSLLLQGLAPSFLFCDYSVFSFRLFGVSPPDEMTRTCCYSYCTRCSIWSCSYCTLFWYTKLQPLHSVVVYGVTAIALCFGIPSYSCCTRL